MNAEHISQLSRLLWILSLIAAFFVINDFYRGHTGIGTFVALLIGSILAYHSGKLTR